MKHQQKFKIHFFLFKSKDLKILKIEFCKSLKKSEKAREQK